MDRGLSRGRPRTDELKNLLRVLIRQLLFETQTLDIASYVAAAVFLGFVGAAACLLPAWRATRVDVVEVLRIE